MLIGDCNIWESNSDDENVQEMESNKMSACIQYRSTEQTKKVRCVMDNSLVDLQE